ncbi:hypothetical protein T02_9184 [Trichinella nativa]|uniref:Uncharacterized protein n=1 Tax=Trichinella nativa TaxID=6335 RepID=A0A0V1KJ33_9BILA|nr:hypothetical protein T02_9184 [Trichinella nativa]
MHKKAVYEENFFAHQRIKDRMQFVVQQAGWSKPEEFLSSEVVHRFLIWIPHFDVVLDYLR